MSISKKVAQYLEKASWIRKMFEEGTRLKAEVGAEKVCDFTLGNPDLEPPRAFFDALRRAAEEPPGGHHRYMPNAGFTDTRAAIAENLSREHKLRFGPEQVILTCGAAGGLNVTLKALLDPGDEVIVLAPYFVEYLFYIDNHGGQARVVPTDGTFDLDLEALAGALSERTRAVLLNSPNNPTGRVYPESSLDKLGQLLGAHSERGGRPIYLLADDPYSKIVYDNLKVPSPFLAHRDTVLITSHSKDLGLPGERIGYAALSPRIPDGRRLFDAMAFANRTLGFVNAPALFQRLIRELQGLTVDTAVYQSRRDRFAAILKEAGLDFFMPQGAFYFFPKSPLDDDVAFVRLLAEEYILAVPGSGFGLPGYFRLAFCVGEEVIERSRGGFLRAMAKAGG